MTNEEAVQIVTSFGGIAEISAITGTDMAAPISMLPYPKETIEIAIETYLDNLIHTRTYTDKARSYLKTSYTMLACFVPDEQVAIVKKGEKALEASAIKAREQEEGGGESSDSGEDENWDEVNKSSEILMRVQEEMAKRQEAIEKYELQQLFAFAAGQ
jgi:hypothetical protein